MFWKYLLLLFQIRSERDTPSSGWQPQAELSEVTKNRNAIPSEALSPPTRLFPFLVRTINQEPQDICHREKPAERVFFTQASILSEINDSEESRLSK